MGSTVRLARIGAAAALALTLGSLGSAALPAGASAQPQALRPGTRPWFVDVGAGWAIDLDGYGASQFKLVEEIGVHFGGDSSGPAIGAALAQGFGNDFFTFQAGAKFWWDIQIISNLGLYVAPFGVLGFAIAVPEFGDAQGFFNFQFGGQVKLVVNDRFNFWVRPLAFDFFAGTDFAVRYDFLAGGVLIF